MSPITDAGTAYRQDGYSFDVRGDCVEADLTDKQRERHFGEGVPEEKTLLGSAVQPANIDISDGVQISLGDVVARAHKDSGYTIDQWNGLPEVEREKLIAGKVEEIRAMVRPAPKPKAPTTVIGAPAPKAEAADAPKEPEKFAPITPPEGPKPARSVAPKDVDLKGWVAGKADYTSQEVIAAVKARYGKGFRSAAQARKYLVDEHGFAG